jgi:DNA-binding LacI/PurR family transcriptional regulator
VFSVNRPDDPAPEAARAAGARVAFLLPLDEISQTPESVTLDNEGAMRQVARRLWNQGHRRIAFAMTSLGTANGPRRLAGLRTAWEERGGSLDEETISIPDVPLGYLTEEGEIEAGRQAAMALLSRSEPPTAIVAVNDLMAVGDLCGARELNLQVPQDLSVVGFDDVAVSRIVQPTLTTLSLPRGQLGRGLIDLLIGEPPTRVREAEVPALVVRESTGPAPTMVERIRKSAARQRS